MDDLGGPLFLETAILRISKLTVPNPLGFREIPSLEHHPFFRGELLVLGDQLPKDFLSWKNQGLPTDSLTTKTLRQLILGPTFTRLHEP